MAQSSAPRDASERSLLGTSDSEQQVKAQVTELHSRMDNPLLEVVQLASGVLTGAGFSSVENATSRKAGQARDQLQLSAFQPQPMPQQFALHTQPSVPSFETHRASSSATFSEIGAARFSDTALLHIKASGPIPMTEAEAKELKRKKKADINARHRAKLRADPIKRLEAKIKKDQSNAKYYATTFKSSDKAAVRAKVAEGNKRRAPRYVEKAGERYRKEQEALGRAVKPRKRSSTANPSQSMASPDGPDASPPRDPPPDRYDTNADALPSTSANGTLRDSSYSLPAASLALRSSSPRPSLLPDSDWLDNLLKTGMEADPFRYLPLEY